MGYAVVIPSCNRTSLLKQALESIYSQTLGADRIYVVIDEVEDKQKYSFLDNYDNRLEVMFTGGGYGGAMARNLGLEKVDSEFVFFLDDDDRWLPRKVEKQIQLLENRVDAVAVTCDSYKSYHGRKTTLRIRDEVQMNRCVKLWNYVGGFSGFGIRWKGEVATLRLIEGLEAAHDHEFYMRVSQFGWIANLRQPQVVYSVHDSGRISDNRLKKRQSYMSILQLDRDMLTFRERCFHVAFAELWSACARRAFWSMLYYHGKGLVYLIIAAQEPRLSYRLWSRSVRTILRTLWKRGRCNNGAEARA